jgi:hypothetical protein
MVLCLTQLDCNRTLIIYAKYSLTLQLREFLHALKPRGAVIGVSGFTLLPNILQRLVLVIVTTIYFLVYYFAVHRGVQRCIKACCLL